MQSVSAGTETTSLDELALIDQLRRREPAALMAAYDRYATSVYSLIIRITRDPTTSADLLQQLFSRLCDRPGSMDSLTANLGVWLLCTARKMAIEQVRPGSTQIACSNPEPVTARPARLGTALLTLDSRQRQVLELAYFHGSSPTEIAALLGQPLETVKSCMHSALRHVRRQMKAERAQSVEQMGQSKS